MNSVLTYIKKPGSIPVVGCLGEKALSYNSGNICITLSQASNYPENYRQVCSLILKILLILRYVMVW